MAPAQLPQGLDRGQHVELEHRAASQWIRRALMGAFAALAVIALLNVVGQRASEVTAAGPAAQLTVRSPTRLRGGLLYQTAFTVVARHHIERLHLVLSPGWFDGITMNTLEPSPGQEGSRNGRVSLSYGTLDPGQRLVVFIEWQVNPTTVDRRDLYANLYDGGKQLARVRRTVTILP